MFKSSVVRRLSFLPVPTPGPLLHRGCFVLLVASLAAPAGAALSPGWQRVAMPAVSSYLELYIPQSLDTSHAAPLVVFLHGSSGTPEDYETYVAPAAEQAGCVLALPKSSNDLGWGFGNDNDIVDAAVSTVAGMLVVDTLRTSIAGHSAGGAYAYLLGYETPSGYNAVFSLSAPFYTVTAIEDPNYTAPIHMYYGSLDPNFTGGSEAQLRARWMSLGVPYEEDLELGYTHDTWPLSAMTAGFLFLTSHTYSSTPCVADGSHSCLLGRRYRVAVTWDNGQSNGTGTVAPASTDSSGIFWFFSPSNWELLVKLVDGCAVNQKVWVFASGTTNVAFTITVTDTVTQQVRTYSNPPGKAAGAIIDTSAFASCP